MEIRKPIGVTDPVEESAGPSNVGIRPQIEVEQGSFEISHRDFSRMQPGESIDEQLGYYQTTYEPHYDVINPWLGQTDATFRAHTEAVFEKLPFTDQIAEMKIDATLPGRSQRSDVYFVLKPNAKVTDEEVFRAVAHTWGRDVAVPRIIINRDTAGAPPPTEAPNITSGGYERLLTIDKGGALRVFADKLSVDEKRALKRWAQSDPKFARSTPARQLLALLRAKTDIGTKAGRLNLEAQTAVGLIQPYVRDAIVLLEKRYGVGALNNTCTVYNGHITLAMTGLLTTLRSMGAATVIMAGGKYSGDPLARSVINAQRPDKVLVPDSPLRQYAESALARSPDEVRGLQSKPIRHIVHKKAENAYASVMSHLASMDSLWPGGKNRIVTNRIGSWLKRFYKESAAPEGQAPVPGPMYRGQIRTVLHNTDDLKDLAPIKDHVYGVDYDSSQIKLAEARFVGQQYALIGAREAREKLGEPIGDVPVTILGFGKYGEQLAEGLRFQGMDPKQVQVWDPDPLAQRRAIEAGFTVVEPGSKPVAPKGVVYVAADREAINAENAFLFAKEAVVIALTSSGKGVATEALKQQATQVDATRVYRNALGDVSDVSANFANGFTIHFATDGNPPNLVCPMWHDRYEATTGVGCAFSMLDANDQTERSIQSIDRETDLALVELLSKHGLEDRRPLDTRAGDRPEDLIADLDSFTASKKTA